MSDLNHNENINESSSQFFELKLDGFDGPIDLLLHLVKKNELEIEKVSLAQVANQYLECLEAMKRIDLDVAGEYLVMATTLLSIKSSVLLNETVDMEVNEEGELVDPHEELLKRLREAQIYKEGARELSKVKMLGFDVFSRPSSLKDIENVDAPIKDHDSMLLVCAFRDVLKRLKEKGEYVVEIDSVSIVERMMIILDKIKNSNGMIKFFDLTKDISSLSELVNSFCALLELCRRHILLLSQDEVFQDISIRVSQLDFDKEKLKKEYTSETNLNMAV